MTNFDKITSSIENLARALVRTNITHSFDVDLGVSKECYYYQSIDGIASYDIEEAIQRNIEWLQKEATK